MFDIKNYKGYLIDLDGTMYKGSEKIEAASEFVQELANQNVPYLFVTNNSSKSPSEVAEKLRNFNIPATSDQVFTTSMATAEFIYEKNPNAAIYVIGEAGLKHALTAKGFTFVEEKPDFVVTGIDHDITYEKFALGCLGVRNGATFISTNGDIAIPTERGLLPGNGALTSVIAVSTTVTPTFIGKPEKIIMEQALKVLGTQKEETLMVGDNYDTDILAGMNAGLDTLLVHTGVTTKEILGGIKKKPTYVIDSLQDWIVHI